MHAWDFEHFMFSRADLTMFTRGDLVWGKLKRFSWWPAIIIHPEDCGRDRKTKTNLFLFWFGDHKISEFDGIKVVAFKEHFAENSKKMGKLLKCAVQEVLTVYAESLQAEFTDLESLLNWANSGFKSFLRVSHSRKRSITELPNIVHEALQSDQFKRQYESDSESENEIDDVLKDVRKGVKALGDICVVCCQPEVKIIMQHPLFVGGVCHTCKKCITKIAVMHPGKIYDICVVCGQGGTIVYCSSKMCLRAYCKLCIDYLAPRESYMEILQNDDWQCYLCENCLDFRCLIKRREFYRAKSIPTPSFPNQKFPIRVIAHNNTALSVIKKKNMANEVYCTEPTYVSQLSNFKYLQFYTDFTKQEFADICADLIYGSYFPHDIQEQRNWMNSFSSSFFRFLFRLDNTKLYNSLVFFIFVSEASMLNADSLSRVLCFLKVDPVSVELGCKKYLVWCNVPHLSFNENLKFTKHQTKEDKLDDEEKILSIFMEPLRNYFQ